MASGGDPRTVIARIEHPSSRRLLVATLLVVPAAVFVTANVLQHELGVGRAATWLDPLFETSGIGWLASAIVLAGPVAALLLAISRFLPIRLVRDGDAWEVRIRVRPDRWAIAIAAVSLAVGGTLAAYLVVENLACVAGIAERC